MISAICDIPQQRADNEKNCLNTSAEVSVKFANSLWLIQQQAAVLVMTSVGGGGCDDVTVVCRHHRSCTAETVTYVSLWAAARPRRATATSAPAKAASLTDTAGTPRRSPVTSPTAAQLPVGARPRWTWSAERRGRWPAF